MTITFVGHGYVGLVTACVFADFGNTVWVVGHTPEKIERLKKGDPIIYEPGLKELLQKNLKAKRILFTLDYDKAIPQSDIIFTAVGTPPKQDGEPDLTAVVEVAKKIAKHLRPGLTVVSCKSTVPVGTNRKIEDILNKNKPTSSKVAVASCPEFLREGSALSDTLNPDRVVIGSDSKEAVDLLIELHRPITGKRVITNLSSAELVKYASNAMLATKISYANLIAFYAESAGADVEVVLDAVGMDRRIGRMFLSPGIGYGGSCLPKDVSALIHIAKDLKVDATFLKMVEEINKRAQKQFIEKVVKTVPRGTLAVWGLSFKPDTDDIRDAPQLTIVSDLLNRGYKIVAYDPTAMENVKKKFGNKISYASSAMAALKNANALCVLTEWNEFKEIDFTKVKNLLKKPVVFDGRNIYDPKQMKNLGFSYFAVGRNT